MCKTHCKNVFGYLFIYLYTNFEVFSCIPVCIPRVHHFSCGYYSCRHFFLLRYAHLLVPTLLYILAAGSWTTRLFFWVCVILLLSQHARGAIFNPCSALDWSFCFFRRGKSRRSRTPSAKRTSTWWTWTWRLSWRRSTPHPTRRGSAVSRVCSVSIFYRLRCWCHPPFGVYIHPPSVDRCGKTSDPASKSAPPPYLFLPAVLLIYNINYF